MTSQSVSPAGLAARVLNFPALIAPTLQRIGQGFARSLAQTDARSFWRWLAMNWHRVAAWWLCLGVVLSVLLGLGLLIAKGKGVPLSLYLFQLVGTVTATSWNMADGLAGFALVVSLPVLLPAALLSLVVLAGLVLIVGTFGPVLLLALCAFGLLFGLALVKVGWFWALDFIVRTITRRDSTRSMVAALGRSLGLDGGATVALVPSPDGTLHTQPRLMEGEEFKRYAKQNRATHRGAFITLGKVNGTPWGYWTEKHVYITASSRSGKGRDLIIPNLRRYPESVFVLDPKGENCIATMRERIELGNVVEVFDPYGLTGQLVSTFNPLDGLIGGGQMVRGADYLAEALIIGEDDHWNESARGLIRAMVLHLLTAPAEHLRGRPRDLPTLRELLTGALDVTLEDMAASEALDGLVSRLAQTVLDLSPNERSGVVSTARRGTKWLDNPELADMFRAGPAAVSFADLRDPEKRVSVFVCLPPDVFGTYPQVCRLLATFALDTMMTSRTGRKRPAMFILDELAQLQRLPIVERAFTLGAGYGVQVWAVFQSVEQARKLYPLDSLYGSSGVRCFFKVEDPETCEYASKAASGVLNPAAIRHLPEQAMLTLLDGANPLIVTRFDPPKAV